MFKIKKADYPIEFPPLGTTQSSCLTSTITQEKPLEEKIVEINKKVNKKKKEASNHSNTSSSLTSTRQVTINKQNNNKKIKSQNSFNRSRNPKSENCQPPIQILQTPPPFFNQEMYPPASHYLAQFPSPPQQTVGLFNPVMMSVPLQSVLLEEFQAAQAKYAKDCEKHFFQQNLNYLKQKLNHYRTHSTRLFGMKRLTFFRELYQFFILQTNSSRISFPLEMCYDLTYFVNTHFEALQQEEKDIILYFLFNDLIQTYIHIEIIAQMQSEIIWYIRNYIKIENGKISDAAFKSLLIFGTSINLNFSHELHSLIRSILIDHLSIPETDIDFSQHKNLECLLYTNELFTIGYYKFIKYLKNEGKELNVDDFYTVLDFMCKLTSIEPRHAFVFIEFFKSYLLILNGFVADEIKRQMILERLKYMLDGSVFFGKIKSEIKLIIMISNNRSPIYS